MNLTEAINAIDQWDSFDQLPEKQQAAICLLVDVATLTRSLLVLATTIEP